MRPSCVSHPASLGDYAFNVSLGESHIFARDHWCSPHEMDSHLASLPHEANSGDVYAIANTGHTGPRFRVAGRR